jgi:hypothetical protein
MLKTLSPVWGLQMPLSAPEYTVLPSMIDEPVGSICYARAKNKTPVTA